MTNINLILQPTNLSEAMRFADMIAKSSFCPAAMKGKSGDVIIAMQMGSEVGLSPLQALQNIAVINGKPCLYGDGALAVAMSSNAYVSHKEWTEGSIEKNNLIAYCEVVRKNSDPYVKSFSMDDAKKAGLWGKTGPWSQYPARMLQMRARAFAIRDKFADALRGINIREEVEDYQPIVREKVINKPVLQIEEDTQEISNLDKAINQLELCSSLEELQAIFKTLYKIFKNDLISLEVLTKLKDEKKSEFEKISHDSITGEIEQPSEYEKIKKSLLNAKSQDTLDLAADLISSLDNEDQKAELREIYNKGKNEI